MLVFSYMLLNPCGGLPARISSAIGILVSDNLLIPNGQR